MNAGSCPSCKLSFRWRGAPIVAHAGCPRCAQPLEDGRRRRFPLDQAPVLRAMVDDLTGRRVGFVAPGVDPGPGRDVL